jgi:hypothetical protein
MTRGLYVYYIMVMVGIAGCAIKTRLSSSDLKWMNCYNQGDTLIFRSDYGQYDTTLIVKKEIFYPPYNPIESDDQFLRQWGVVWYKNKHLKYHPDGYQLVSLMKKRPNETFLSIDYLYSSVLYQNINNGEIDKVKKDNEYEFDTYHPKADPDQPKTIFWNEGYGIIRYITHDGMTWRRINFPQKTGQ